MNKKYYILAFSILVLFTGVTYSQDLTQQGLALLQKKDYEGAAAVLRRAVETSPRSEKANAYFGEALLYLGKLDSAEIFLKKAVDLNNEYAEAYALLGDLYVQKKDIPSAIENYKLASKYDNKNIGYVLKLGDAELQADSLDAAMASFVKATTIQEKNPRAIEGIGDVYLKQNIYSAAIDKYNEALTYDSLNVPLRLKLANTYMKNGDGANAYEQFVKASNLDPNNADAQLQAGELLYINRHYSEAIPFLQKYHELKPGDQKELLHLGIALFRSGRFHDAIETFKNYLKVEPNSIDVKKALAAAYHFEKNYEDSYKVYSSIPFDSLDAKDLVRFGLDANSIPQRDTSTVIKAWSRAVQLDTTSQLSEIEYLLGTVLFGAKDYTAAIAHFQRRLTFEPNDVAALLNMGLCYFIIQDYSHAISALRKVTELKPQNLQGQLWLARAYIYADSLEQAKDVYQNVIRVAINDTTGDHSQDLNEAYRQTALYQIITGSKLQKDRPEEAKRFYSDALPNLMTALRYDPKEPKTHALLAQDYALLGKIDDACKEIKIVLRVDPRNEQMLKLQKSLGCE